MRRYCSSLATVTVVAIATTLASTAAAQGNAPVVTNVVAEQIEGTGTVHVTFDVSDADGDSVTVSVIFSSDNGTTFDLLPRSISGDVNKRIAPGTGKLIVWDAAADHPGFYWPQVVAKVIANDGQVPGAEMVLVPAGTFLRGNSANAGSGDGYAHPQRSVHVDSFYIDKFEVTVAEYKVFIDAGGYTTRAYWSTTGWTRRESHGWTAPRDWGDEYNGPNYPGFPVTGVSWYEAEAYANFVRKRLPTEAEWEKAARGEDGRTYPWGETLDNRRANWLNSSDPNDNFPTPVGYFNGTLYQGIFQSIDSPSPYGTYDQAGGVEEWVRDWHGSSYYNQAPSSNPPGPSSGSERVLRGGSFIIGETYIRTFHRRKDNPTDRTNSAGFRLARPVVR